MNSYKNCTFFIIESFKQFEQNKLKSNLNDMTVLSSISESSLGQIPCWADL